MAFFRNDCPSCKTKYQSFYVSSCHIMHLEHRSQEHRSQLDDKYTIGFFAICEQCHFPVSGICEWSGRHEAGVREHLSKRSGIAFSNQGSKDTYSPRLLEVYPKSVASRIPEHLPDNIRDSFSEAVDTLQRGNHGLAGTGFRRALERATKNLAPNNRDKNLYQRIEVLKSSGFLNEALYNWATEIRHLGNDAVHEEDDPSPDEVKEMADFTEVFLTYCFTLPKRIEEMKARRTQRSGKAG